MTNIDIPDFLTIAEFAAKMRIHINTVRRGIKSGRIATFKTGSLKRPCYRIPYTEINRLIYADLRELVKQQILEEK